MRRRCPVCGSGSSMRRTMMPCPVMASIRRMSPLARARPDLVRRPHGRWRGTIRSPGPALAPSAICTVRAASTRPRWMRSSRIGADSSRQRASRGREDHVPAGHLRRDVGLDRLIHGLFGLGAVDPAVLVVVVQRGRVPLVEPQRGVAFPRRGNRTGSASCTYPSRLASSISPPPPSTAASCSWSPARTTLQPFRAAWPIRAARWVMETIEPSSTTISEPAGTRPCSMPASSPVVFAATWTPALRNSFVAFWDVGVPKTCPGRLPGPMPAPRPRARGSCHTRGPDDHLCGPGGGEHAVDGGGLA